MPSIKWCTAPTGCQTYHMSYLTCITNKSLTTSFSPNLPLCHHNPLIQRRCALSSSPFPTQHVYDSVVSISTTFYPGALTLESDVCFSSSDTVLFYVHSYIIWAASETAFSSFLSEEAAVLNIILHTLYSTSCAQHSPSLQTMVTAVERMPFYNLDPVQFIQPGLPLYTLLLSSAPLYPIEIYCLAAKFNLEGLAVNTSSHL